MYMYMFIYVYICIYMSLSLFAIYDFFFPREEEKIGKKKQGRMTVVCKTGDYFVQNIYMHISIKALILLEGK